MIQLTARTSSGAILLASSAPVKPASVGESPVACPECRTTVRFDSTRFGATIAVCGCGAKPVARISPEDWVEPNPVVITGADRSGERGWSKKIEVICENPECRRPFWARPKRPRKACSQACYLRMLGKRRRETMYRDKLCRCGRIWRARLDWPTDVCGRCRKTEWQRQVRLAKIAARQQTEMPHHRGVA